VQKEWESGVRMWNGRGIGRGRKTGKGSDRWKESGSCSPT